MENSGEASKEMGAEYDWSVVVGYGDEIEHCSIYIGKDEPNPGAAYRRAMAALEERMKKAAQI